MAWSLIKSSTKAWGKPVTEVRSRPIWRIEDIAGRVREIVAEDLGVDIARVVPEADWYEDFGCSLDVVEIFMRCEEEFDIVIPDEDTEHCPTVGTLTSYIEKQLRARETR